MTTSASVELDVEVRTLDDMDAINEAVELLRTIWGFPGAEAPVSGGVMRALSYAGGYAAGAFADGQLIGVSAGFLALRHDALHLHSHITGVLADWQSRHVGLALKAHQRAWALERGINVIEWTFDPLVRRNAYFNLVKLGAAVVGFEPNFYGDMDDAINAGDLTDRAVVHWQLDADPVRRESLDGDVILQADDKGQPMTSHARGARLRAWIPEDAVGLRKSDPGTALAWRVALRESLGAAVADGYAATSMTRDGWYTLERAGS
jgi:predicted GNAT superfamily acetyltransferase